MTEPEVEPAAPNTAKLARRLVAAVIVLCLVVVGLSVYTRWATADANGRAAKAAMQAQHAIDCLNDTLAARAPTTASDNAEHVEFQNAFTDDSIAFGVLLTDILTNAPSSKSTPDFLAYIKVHDRLIAVSKSVSTILQTNQDYRDANPLGAC